MKRKVKSSIDNLDNYSIHVVLDNENKRSNDREADPIDDIICKGRVG